jgi:ABC-type uncharacterized transport system substrate-binding protein
MLSRRRFLQGVSASLLAGPLAAEAQQAGKVARVGFLGIGPFPSPQEIAQSPFVVAMKERGWVEGQNLIVERRFGQSTDQLHEFAAELGRLKVDVLVVISGAHAAIARREAKDTAIVVVGSGADLVRMGLVASLARPGGHVTGSQVLQTDLFGKHLELLRELVPNLSRVALLREGVPVDPAPTEAARSLGVELHVFRAVRPEDFPVLFDDMVKKGDRGLIVWATPFLYAHRKQINDLTTTHRIPAVYSLKAWVEAGGLMSYGAKNPLAWRRTAAFVDKILKGAKPGDLPVEQSTEFEMVINLKTAKALGLTIPPSLLRRADQIID